MAMTAMTFCTLKNRGILEISGPDTRDFLQGIISNDVTGLDSEHALYAALLTPQGKFLFDFFLMENGDRLLLDCELDRVAALERRLKFYKLRADVTVTDRSDEYDVYALFGGDAAEIVGLTNEPAAAATSDEAGVRCIDPRLAAMGVRIALRHDRLSKLQDEFPKLPPLTAGDEGLAAYEAWRIGNGVADGSRDIAVEKYFLLEANFDALSGVDFKKGCYVGQELVSRMKHRNAVRRRILPVTAQGTLPPPQTPIVTQDGRDAGILLTGVGNRALAYLRLEMLDQPLGAGDASLRVEVPEWLRPFIAESLNGGDDR